MEDQPLTLPLPKHGTRARKRLTGCTCVPCSRRTGAVEDGYLPRWSWEFLSRRVGPDRIRQWFDAEQIEEWRKIGLSDEEADMASLMLGLHPALVWQGWVEAGLDWPGAEDDDVVG